MRLDTTQHEEKNCRNLAIVQVDEGGDSQCDRDPVDRQIRFQNYVGGKIQVREGSKGE